jgi:hypothetical protein
MDKVTQQNAASSEQSSAAAAELSGQSSDLKALVGTFRLEHREGADRDARPPPAAYAAVPAARPLAARKGNGRTSGMTAMGLRPEEIIPLDGEGSFKDF